MEIPTQGDLLFLILEVFLTCPRKDICERFLSIPNLATLLTYLQNGNIYPQSQPSSTSKRTAQPVMDRVAPFARSAPPSIGLSRHHNLHGKRHIISNDELHLLGRCDLVTL